jgi:hypothetical protein
MLIQYIKTATEIKLIKLVCFTVFRKSDIGSRIEQSKNKVGETRIAFLELNTG